MSRTQLAKLLRDLLAYRGRLAAMFVAVSASLVGVGAILDGYTVLEREVSRAYLSTRPAHATFDIGTADEALVADIERLSYVSAAEARSTVNARIRAEDGEWVPLRLFVVAAFDAMRLSVFLPDQGAWPPPTGTLLVERSSDEVLPFRIGQGFEVVVDGGPVTTLLVSGTVHDTGLAPAWQEQTVWGYATLPTFRLLGGPATPEEVKVLFDADPRDGETILSRTRALAAWLAGRGIAVHGIQVPPAGLHPHQGQMSSILALFLVFGLLILASSAILVATLLSGLLSKETRSVGILKTLGAGPGRIVIQYLALVGVPLCASLVAAIPLGLALGRALAGNVSVALNLGAIDTRIEVLPVLAQVVAGLIVPSLFCLAPLLRLSSLPIRMALTYTGTAKLGVAHRIGSFSLWLGARARWLTLSTRNLFRKRGRLFLTLGLLGSAGMLFLATSNIVASQRSVLESTFKTRPFDYELRLGTAVDGPAAVDALQAVDGIASVESWPSLVIERPAADGLPLSRVYPDGGHGSLILRGVPPASTMAGQQPLAGQGLAGIPSGSLVMNRGAWSAYGEPNVGAGIEFYMEGKPHSGTLAGVVSEIGLGSIYVSQTDMGAVSGREAASNTFRLRSVDSTGRLPAQVQAEVEAVLRGFGATVNLAFSETTFRVALLGHTETLTFSLYFLSVLLGVVGLLGLSSALGSSVAERRREFGVMRTIGATPGIVMRTILAEALGLALLSLGIGFALSLPLSSLLGAFLGTLSLRQPYPLTVSGARLLVWTIASTAAASLSAIGPARSAAGLSVREALAYE
jgi:putative ABC transport system permease protein